MAQRDTTQHELLQMAEKHKDDKSIAWALIAIGTARVDLELNMNRMQAQIQVIENALGGHKGYSIPWRPDIAVPAVAVDTDCRIMSEMFGLLATRLLELGEDVSY